MKPARPSDPPAAPADNYYRKRTDWSGSTGKLNISVFVFRDTNRSGHYDVGDRPMASVAVEMRAEEEPPLVKHSNIAGFTNFEMSTTEEISPITRPGWRTFEVIPPHGWVVTTGNAVQEVEFVPLAGSVSGLIAPHPPKLVGLAPDLEVRTTLDPADSEWSAKGELNLRRIGQSEHEPREGAPLSWRRHDSISDFSIPSDAGTFELVRGRLARPVTVGSFPTHVGTLTPGRDYASDDGSEWRTINFESAVQAGIGKIPTGYAGMGWDNFVAVDNAFYQGEGYVNGTVSGRMVTYNGSGHPAEVSHEKGFDLLGCHLTLGWIRAEGEVVIIEAYQGDVLVAVDRVELSALGPVWYEPRFRNVTRVRFGTEHFWQFIMDELVVRV
ncbi:hypothetical protein [Verrucomicrobium sp. BvORR106]|uniref:hypothetical protein n=1 Tax=Verrucomicrobium sp. BvORR106 TaxID=1403819 RepID=UPI00068D6F40|nr:hypothetical protein [Verrucomicrobium sp. BvORR106]